MTERSADADMAYGGAPFTEPFVDTDEWRDLPVSHRYVHGGFAGTDLLFSIYLPPADRYHGRFFQPLLHIAGTHQGAIEGLYDGMGGSLSFAFASGAYLVESNMGTLTATPGADPTIAYRANAAAAHFARQVALEMYGGTRPFGYVYGGSGGAFKTLACVERLPEVWDGSAPFVMGSPMAIPNVFSVQAHAIRVLGDTLPQIVDAIDAGGSGDMFAGLTVEQRQALAEVTRMGFPPLAWFDVDRVHVEYTMLFTVFADLIRFVDPGYYDEFWTVPGYLGADPPASLLAARIRRSTTITAMVSTGEIDPQRSPVPLAGVTTGDGGALVGVRVVGLPDDHVSTTGLRGASLLVTSGQAQGRRLYVMNVIDGVLIPGAGGDPAGLAGLAVGDEITVDNADYLAFQTYHRHQVPEGCAVWDQFTVTGAPIYPQRPRLLGPLGAFGGAGALQTGRFHGKMIAVEAMMDEAAYPWQADWYRQRAAETFGAALEDRFRLWMVDNAMHGAHFTASPDDPAWSERRTRIVHYGGVMEAALRDLIDWVEHGTPPPASTGYTVIDGQVVLADGAAQRAGVQPVVQLTAAASSQPGSGASKYEATVDEAVEFTAVIEVPRFAGDIAEIEWDLTGRGDFTPAEFDRSMPTRALTVTTNHAFDAPGTYFAVVRVTSQRERDRRADVARIHNLARVRVVVS